MANKDNGENVFQKLTRLFRSGPTVRKKIISTDTSVAVPGRGKSSAARIFQKSVSPTYNQITNSTFSVQERLSRYQDYCEMELCLSGRTLIASPEYEGGFVEIEKLAEECAKNPDKTFIVYAYDHEQGCLIPTLGKQARKTTTDHAWKVTFDNGESIIGSYEHRLMLRDGTYCKIGDLKPEMAMMPFYRRDLYAKKEDAETKGYNWIYTMSKSFSYNGWEPEHRIVARFVSGRNLKENEVVHHINFIKEDNRPSNLLIMDDAEHRAYHAKIVNGKKWSVENSEWIEKFKKNHSKFMKENNPVKRHDITFGRILETCERVGFNIVKIQEALDADLDVIGRRLKEQGFKNFSTFAKAYQPGWRNGGWDNDGQKNPRFDNSITFETVCAAYTKGMTLKELAAKMGYSTCKVEKRIQMRGYKNFKHFANEYQNMKVVSVEYYGIIDLFDLTVDGYKNFATSTVVAHNTPELNACLNLYADETCSSDEKGRVLHIYSNNSKIRSVLEDLFYNNLNIEFNLRAWVRNLPIRHSTGIPLLDGRTIPISQLAAETKEGKENWVYSVQAGTNRMVPGKVVWCDLTRKDTELVRVWLDDETYVDTTPDHEFVMRDGSSKRADELLSGESLMPFYRKISDKKEGDSLHGYEKVYDPARNGFEYTHRLVSKEACQNIGETEWSVIHHVDFIKTNLSEISSAALNKNQKLACSPLTHMPLKNHKVLRVEKLSEKDDVFCMEVHGPNGERDRHNFAVVSTNSSGNSAISGIYLVNCKYGDAFLLNDVDPKLGVVNVIPIPVNHIERIENFDPNDPFAVKFRWVDKNKELDNWEVTHMRLLGNDMFLPYGSSVIEGARRIWRQLILIEDAMLTYRITRSPERRVFYIDIGAIPPDEVGHYMEQVKSTLRSSLVADAASGRTDQRYSPLSIEEDYFLPVRGTESGTKIDTLKGGENVGTVNDVEYIQKKLFSALQVPKAYLGYEEALGSKASLAQIDVRFSRTITMIQRTIISELNKLAMVHLAVAGYSEQDLVNFSLRLSNPSSVAQQQKLELIRSKFEIMGAAPEGLLSRDWLRTNVMGLTPEEILQVEKEILDDSASAAAREAAQLGGGSTDEGLDLGGGLEGLPGSAPGGAESAPGAPPESEVVSSGFDREEDLILAGEREEERESDLPIRLSMKDDNSPVKVQNQLDRLLYNRGRRRHSGSATHGMPDLAKMTGTKTPGMKDVSDSSFIRSFSKLGAVSESTRQVNIDPFLNGDDPGLSRDFANMLENMKRKLKINSGTSNVLFENVDEIDFEDIEDDEQK